jgi:hypothetical protein
MFQRTQSYYEFEPDTSFEERSEKGVYANRRIRIVVTPVNFWFEIVDLFWPNGVVGLPQDRTRFACKPYEYTPISATPEVSVASQIMGWLRDELIHGRAAQEAVTRALWVLELAPSLRKEKETFLKEFCPRFYDLQEHVFEKSLRDSAEATTNETAKK